jgi:hypothetical protein
MQRIQSTFDPIQSELSRYFDAQDAAESHDDAVSERADAIANNPTVEQFADVFCGMGCARGEIEKLRTAWLTGKEAFLAEVMAQMNAGFVSVADLEISESDALACDAREVLSDW